MKHVYQMKNKMFHPGRSGMMGHRVWTVCQIGWVRRLGTPKRTNSCLALLSYFAQPHVNGL